MHSRPVLFRVGTSPLGIEHRVVPRDLKGVFGNGGGSTVARSAHFYVDLDWVRGHPERFRTESHRPTFLGPDKYRGVAIVGDETYAEMHWQAITRNFDARWQRSVVNCHSAKTGFLGENCPSLSSGRKVSRARTAFAFSLPRETVTGAKRTRPEA